MIQRMRNLCLMLSAAAVFVAAPAMAGPTTDVLKHVPKDAWGFAVVRSINTIDKNIAQLQDFGLPIMPGFRLGALLQNPPFNLGDSADLERPLCVVMLDMKKFGKADAENAPPDASRAVALLLPAKDPKAIMKKLAVGESEGAGVRKISITDQQLYAVEMDNYLVVGKSEKTVKEISAYSGDGPPLADARKALMELTDVYVSFSVDHVYGTYGMQFAPVMQMAMMQADPTGKSWQRFDKLVKEMDSFDFGLRMDDKGIAMRGLLLPKKDSDLEQFMKDTKNIKSSKLKLLPKEDYLVAWGSTMSYSDQAEKFADQNPIASLVRTLQLADVDQATVKAIDAECMKLTKEAKAQATTFTMLPGGSQGRIGFASVVETDKPEMYIDGIRKIYKNIWRISSSEELKKAKGLLTHTPDAETIEGGKVDTLTLNNKQLIEELEIAPDDVKALKSLLGEDLTVRFGVVGDKHVVLTFGGGKDRYGEVAKLVKSGGETTLASDTGIKTTSQNLADPRSTEIYISVENFMRLIKVATKEIDGEDAIPFDIPNIDAPAGFDAAAVDSGIRFDMFVPMKLVDAIKKAVKEQAAHDMEAFDEMDSDTEGDMGNDSGAKPGEKKSDDSGDDDMGG